VSGENFNPQNTACIPAVKIFAFLELEQISSFMDGHYAIFYMKVNSVPYAASLVTFKRGALQA
jgi:hypothetical protein